MACRQKEGTSGGAPPRTATLDAHEQEQLGEAILAMGAQAAEAQAQITWMAERGNEGKVPPAIAEAALSQLPAVIGVLVATELGLREQLHQSIVVGTHIEGDSDGSDDRAMMTMYPDGMDGDPGGTGDEPECAKLRAAADAACRGIEAAIVAYHQCRAAIPAKRKLSPGMSAEQLQELLGNLALAGDMAGVSYTDPKFKYHGDGNVLTDSYQPASKTLAATGPTATDHAYAAFERARQEQVAVLTPQIMVDVGLYDDALREAWDAAAAAAAAADEAAAEDANASARIEGDGSISAPLQRCPAGPEHCSRALTYTPLGHRMVTCVAGCPPTGCVPPSRSRATPTAPATAAPHLDAAMGRLRRQSTARAAMLAAPSAAAAPTRSRRRRRGSATGRPICG